MPPVDGMHALTGCDTTSFPFNKGKVSALSVLEAGDFPGLFNVLGEEDAMRWDLLEVGTFCSCKKEGLSCTIYCLCQSGDECCNPHKRSQQVDDEDENNGEPQEYEALDADSSAESECNKQRSFIAFIIVI